jgi:hypothetical protein
MRLGTDETLEKIRSNKTYIPILMKAFNFDSYSQRDGSSTNYNTNSTRAPTGAYVVSSDAGMEAFDVNDEDDGQSEGQEDSEGLDADGDGVMLHSSGMDATSAVELDAEQRREQLTQEISAHLSQSSPNIMRGDKSRNSTIRIWIIHEPMTLIIVRS